VRSNGGNEGKNIKYSLHDDVSDTEKDEPLDDKVPKY
jgi:hypothetical protein